MNTHRQGRAECSASGFKCLIITILLAGLSTGCSNLQRLHYDSARAGSYLGVIPDHQVQRSTHLVFPLSTGIYISWGDAHPYDTDNAETYAAMLLYEEVAQRFPRTLLAPEAQSASAALEGSRQQRLEYLLYPRLMLWQETRGYRGEISYSSRQQEVPPIEPAPAAAPHDQVYDFASPWEPAGITRQNPPRSYRDKARLQVTVVEAASGRIVDVVVIDTRTGLLTAYRDNPQSLLRTALSQYADSMYPF